MSTAKLEKYRRVLRDGEVLFKEGETPTSFFMVERGVLDYYIQGEKTDSVRIKGEGMLLGENAALLGLKHTFTVLAAVECSVVELPVADLETIFDEAPEFCAALMAVMARRNNRKSSTMPKPPLVSGPPVFEAGNTELSLRNYAKGLLHLIQQASDNGDAKAVLQYFLSTNPWGIADGDPDMVLTDD